MLQQLHMLLQVLFVKNSPRCDCVDVHATLRGILRENVVDWGVQILRMRYVGQILTVVGVLRGQAVWKRRAFDWELLVIWTNSCIEPMDV